MDSTGKWQHVYMFLSTWLMELKSFAFRNIATNWMGRATIIAGTAGQQYVDNIFENPDNDYEIITVNSSM